MALGAALTSFLANRFGFPVSTTHALLGALVGSGLSAQGYDQVQLSALRKTFLYPLFFSPWIAFVSGWALYGILGRLDLAPSYRTKNLDRAHFVSSGAASFARGLNDTPKIAALLLMVPWLDPSACIMLIGILIALGAILDAKHVAETLGKKVTDMNPGQGFAANLVTSILVATASLHSLPVSTTHVSVGALLGMGACTQQAKWSKLLQIVLAWITTVPIAAALAAVVYWLMIWVLG